MAPPLIRAVLRSNRGGSRNDLPSHHRTRSCRHKSKGKRRGKIPDSFPDSPCLFVNDAVPDHAQDHQRIRIMRLLQHFPVVPEPALKFEPTVLGLVLFCRLAEIRHRLHQMNKSRHIRHAPLRIVILVQPSSAIRSREQIGPALERESAPDEDRSSPLKRNRAEGLDPAGELDRARSALRGSRCCCGPSACLRASAGTSGPANAASPDTPSAASTGRYHY